MSAKFKIGDFVKSRYLNISGRITQIHSYLPEPPQKELRYEYVVEYDEETRKGYMKDMIEWSLQNMPTKIGDNIDGYLYSGEMSFQEEEIELDLAKIRNETFGKIINKK